MECIICHSTEFESIKYPKDNNPLGFEWILSCTKCTFGMVETSLKQNDLDDFYKNGEYWHRIENSIPVLKHSYLQAKHRLNTVTPFLQNTDCPKILDVGAGHGFIGRASKELLSKFTYYYLESDTEVHTEIKTNCETAKEYTDQDDFHLIFLNHVLEHVIDPKSFLNHFMEKLTPEGILYIEVPNLDYHYKSDVFPHTLFFHRESLIKLAESMGLEVVKAKTFGRLPNDSVFSKVCQKLFNFSAKKDLKAMYSFLGDQIFSYTKEIDDGIWNSIILKKKSH